MKQTAQIDEWWIPDFTYAALKGLLNEVMRTEVSAFRINIGFGVVLFNVVNQDYVSHNRILECKVHILFSKKNHAEIKIIRIRGIDFIKQKSLGLLYPWAMTSKLTLQRQFMWLSWPFGVNIRGLETVTKELKSKLEAETGQGYINARTHCRGISYSTLRVSEKDYIHI